MKQQNLFASSFLRYIESSKAAGKIIRMFEDCLYKDTEEAKSYHICYGIEPDHEIWINTVTIYLKFSDADPVKLNQKGNTVSILEELKEKNKTWQRPYYSLIKD